jgi:hypothetical protein
MVNTRRKNQAARGASANAAGALEEQPSANGPSPRHQPEEARPAGPAIFEQRMTTMEDGMLDLKEMIRKQAEEIERMNGNEKHGRSNRRNFKQFWPTSGCASNFLNDMRISKRDKIPKWRSKSPWLVLRYRVPTLR